MAGCADPDCKNDLKNLKEYTYGKEPGQGLMGKIDEAKSEARTAFVATERKVPKVWIWDFILAFGIIILTVFIVGYHTVQMASLVSVDAKRIGDENQKEIRILSLNDAVMREQYSSIYQSLGDIKAQLEKLTTKGIVNGGH